MKKSLQLAACCLFAASHSIILEAAPVIEYNASGEATGISNLSIAGMDNLLFNLDFIDGTYNSVYATRNPYFLDNPTGALNANSAMIDALIDNNVLKIAGISGVCGVSSPRLLCQINIPNGIISATSYEFIGARTDPGNLWIPVLGADSRTIVTDFRVFTQFTLVPIPASVLLFSSGLLVLTGISRRKKAA